MALIINGSASERKTIEQWLQQICWSVSVNPGDGAVSIIPAPPAPGYMSSGCNCLSTIINSHRTVTIQPLPFPFVDVPGTNGMSIRECGGGASSPDDTSGAYVQSNGKPGKGADGKVGSDCTVYVDISNNKGAGYDDPLVPGNPSEPMWLVLAHELTSGHAFHNVQGTAAMTPAERQKQANISENEHRAEHKIPLIPPDKLEDGD